MATSKTKQATAKKPPKKKLQRVKGSKAKNKEDSRKTVPIYGASDYRIWRHFDVEHERWVRWTPNATGQKLVNSRVHLYGREVGYSNGEDESHFDSHLKAVEERLRNISYLKNSGPWRISNQGNFECYVLKAHATDPYAMFLLGIENPKPDEPRKAIHRPSQLLVQAYICHMSDEGDKMQVGVEGRSNDFHSVRGRLGAVSGTLREFGIPTGLEKDATTSKLVDHLRESNDPRIAPAFSLEEALPKLFHTLFTLSTFPTWSKKVRVWPRLLVTIALIARSSDVTDYCPKLENIKIPDDPIEFFALLVIEFFSRAIKPVHLVPDGRKHCWCSEGSLPVFRLVIAARLRSLSLLLLLLAHFNHRQSYSPPLPTVDNCSRDS
jgi:hypothetical protein